MNLLKNTYIDKNKLDITSRPEQQTSFVRNPLIVKKGIEKLVKDEGTGEVTKIIEHNLGYIPSVLVFGSIDGRKTFLRLPYSRIKAAQFSENYEVELNEQNLIFKAQSADTAGILPPNAIEIDIKYIIFREKAN